jgi:hypothetical protein
MRMHACTHTACCMHTLYLSTDMYAYMCMHACTNIACLLQVCHMGTHGGQLLQERLQIYMPSPIGSALSVWTYNGHEVRTILECACIRWSLPLHFLHGLAQSLTVAVVEVWLTYCAHGLLVQPEQASNVDESVFTCLASFHTAVVYSTMLTQSYKFFKRTPRIHAFKAGAELRQLRAAKR